MTRIKLSAGTIGLVLAGLTIWLQAASMVYLGLADVNMELARPWTILEAAFRFAHVPGNTEDVLISLVTPIAAVAALVVALIASRPPKPFGDARWARDAEIRKAGLRAPNGILLGRKGGDFLRHDGPAHVLVSAPTRSGKGVGVVIPNLLSWPGSVVVLDIKQENFSVTAGYRDAHGQDVFMWSPTDPQGRSHRYNPLDAVRPDPKFRVSDLQQIARFLIPTPPRTEPMWSAEARDLFVGLALYVLDTKEVPVTLGQILRTLKTDSELGEVCEHLLETRDDLDPACRMALGSFAKKAEKERSGVKSSLTAALSLLANPLIDAATAASDFNLADLRRKPISIYVGVPLNQLETLKPLVTLFFQQCVDILSRNIPSADEPNEVLLLIDEFASLGRMDVLASALPFLAGFNVRAMLITQGLSQLDEHYHQAGRNSILQNTALQVYFAANDQATVRHVSEKLGMATINTRSVSRQTGFLADTWRAASENIGITGRAFLLPEEVQRLSQKNEIVFLEGHRPVLAKKIRYFANKAFQERLLPSLMVPTLTVLQLHPPIFMLDSNRRSSTQDRDPPDADARSELLALGDEISKLLKPGTLSG